MLGTARASAAGQLCSTAGMSDPRVLVSAEMRVLKTLSPALDQKEADSFLMRGIVQNEKCLVYVEMCRKVRGTINGQGSCLATSDSGFTYPLRNLSSFHHINATAK